MPKFLTTRVREYIGFSLIGGGTFFLNIASLYILNGILGVHYLIAVPAAFAVSSVIHFSIARAFVFPGTARAFSMGLVYFLMFAVINGGIITIGTAWLVEIALLNLYIARTLMGVVSGLLNYSLNARYNFRVL